MPKYVRQQALWDNAHMGYKGIGCSKFRVRKTEMTYLFVCRSPYIVDEHILH